MKKIALTGMVLSTLVSGSVFAQGRPRAAETVIRAQEVKVEMAKDREALKRHLMNNGRMDTSAAGLSKTRKMIQDYRLGSEAVLTDIVTVKPGNPESVVAERMDNLAAIAGAKSTAGRLKNSTLMTTADALTGFTVVSAKAGASKSPENFRSQKMNSAERTDIVDGLKKFESETENILAMEASAQKPIAEIGKRAKELLDQGLNSEEALLQAVMEKQNITREQALEKIRQWKTCRS